MFCLIIGIIVGRSAGVLVLAAVLAVAVLIVSYRIYKKKVHKMYLIFPVLILTGFLIINYSDRIYNFTESNVELTGSVYKVKESSYGYMLYVRKNIFDRERYIVYSDKEYGEGTVIYVKGSATGFSRPSNPGEFNSKAYYNSLKIKGKITPDVIEIVKKDHDIILSYTGKLSDMLDNNYKKICSAKYSSVFSAMILGKKDELDDGLQTLFSDNGIGHILAISGLHISLIGMALYKLIKRMGAGDILSMAVSVILIGLYGIMTGNNVSTVRAVVMFSAMVYSNVAEKTYDIASASALAAMVSLLDAPLFLFNCSFLLSYLAIIGIAYIFPTVKNIFEYNGKLFDGFIASLSIQLATLPVNLFYFFKIQLLSVLLNIVVIPMMTLVMISAIISGAVCFISPELGKLTIGAAVYSLKLFEILCQMCGKIPSSVWTPGRPSGAGIIIYYVIVLIFLMQPFKEKRKWNIGIIVPSIVAISIRFHNYFEMTFIDVGQGDGIYMETPKGTTVLIDGGSSDNKKLYEYTLEPFLLSKGKKNLDAVIVTHCDNDHISGIKKIFTQNNIKVKTLYMPSTTLTDEVYTELIELAAKSGTDIKYIYEGYSMTEEDFYMYCIHPEYGYNTSERNDYSTTLYVRYESFSALLTGDISGEVENEILQKYENFPEITLLKAAHHGSRFSNTEAFIDEFAPQNIVISCGKDNSYGHPHRETIERFENKGIPWLTTMENGAITVTVNRKSTEINTYLEK